MEYDLATPERVCFDRAEWPAIRFYKLYRSNEIGVPPWQRNARWSNADEESYIETLIRYRESAEFSVHLRKTEESEGAPRSYVYDILEGINRFIALKKFFGNALSISTREIAPDGDHAPPDSHRVMYCSLTPPQREIVKNIRLSVRVYDEETPEEHLKRVFLTRNMGKPVSSCEIIHSMTDHPLVERLIIPMDRRFESAAEKLQSGSSWKVRNHGMYHIWVMMAAMVLSDNLLLPYDSNPIREWLIKQYRAKPPTEEEIERTGAVGEYTMEAMLDWGMHGKIPGGKKALVDVAWVFYAYGCSLGVLGAVKDALEQIMHEDNHWAAGVNNSIAHQIGRRETLGGMVQRALRLPQPKADYGHRINNRGKKLMACELRNTALTTTHDEEDALYHQQHLRVHAEPGDEGKMTFDTERLVQLCDYCTVDGREADAISERKRKRKEAEEFDEF